MPRISSKRQVTLPVAALEQAGVWAGDEVAIEAEGPDRVVVRRAMSDPAEALGIFDVRMPAGRSAPSPLRPQAACLSQAAQVSKADSRQALLGEPRLPTSRS